MCLWINAGVAHWKLFFREKQDFKVRIFWEGHSPPYFWLSIHRTKLRWRFLKILWPSQKIWTLPPSPSSVPPPLPLFRRSAGSRLTSTTSRVAFTSKPVFYSSPKIQGGKKATVSTQRQPPRHGLDTNPHRFHSDKNAKKIPYCW